MDNNSLNEQTYNKDKKRSIIIVLVVLVIGICASGFLIFAGIKQINVGRILNNLQEEKSRIKDEMVSYESNKNEEFLTNGLSEEYYRLDNKISELKADNATIEKKLSNDYVNFSNDTMIFYFIFGGVIIIVSLMISGYMFIKTYNINILSFAGKHKDTTIEEELDKENKEDCIEEDE